MRNIFVVASFILCPMSVLYAGATSQGEATASISERDGIIEKPAFYLRQQKGYYPKAVLREELSRISPLFVPPSLSVMS